MNKKIWTNLQNHLTPNIGTIVIVALMLFVYSAYAAPSTQTTISTFPYQGTLTDASGNPVTGDVDMTFRIYDVSTGDTALWTEAHTSANAVSVENGLFQLMLGSLVPIPETVWGNGSLYLELQVGSDAPMNPRELIGSVPRAIQADIATNLTEGAIARGSLSVEGSLDVNGAGSFANDTLEIQRWDENNADIDNLLPGSTFGAIIKGPINGHHVFGLRENDSSDKISFITGGGDYASNSTFDTLAMTINANGDVQINKKLISENVQDVNENRGGTIILDGGSTYLAIDNNEIATYGGNLILQGSNSSEDVVVANNLDVKGSLIGGAYVESNLLTAKQNETKVIAEFSLGDVLCWASKTQQLEKCSQEASPLIVAVADKDGKPIILGAEPIKVLGPVQAGNLLVASDTSGYAVAWSQIGEGEPPIATTIAQALENCDKETCLIKAMIRKW